MIVNLKFVSLFIILASSPSTLIVALDSSSTAPASASSSSSASAASTSAGAAASVPASAGFGAGVDGELHLLTPAASSVASSRSETPPLDQLDLEPLDHLLTSADSSPSSSSTSSSTSLSSSSSSSSSSSLSSSSSAPAAASNPRQDSFMTTLQDRLRSLAAAASAGRHVMGLSATFFSSPLSTPIISAKSSHKNRDDDNDNNDDGTSLLDESPEKRKAAGFLSTSPRRSLYFRQKRHAPATATVSLDRIFSANPVDSEPALSLSGRIDVSFGDTVDHGASKEETFGRAHQAAQDGGGSIFVSFDSLFIPIRSIPSFSVIFFDNSEQDESSSSLVLPWTDANKQERTLSFDSDPKPLAASVGEPKSEEHHDAVAILDESSVDSVKEKTQDSPVADAGVSSRAGLLWRKLKAVVNRLFKGSRRADSGTPSIALHSEAWLEVLDRRHRYGPYLAEYHAVWKRSGTKQPFFEWLDKGEGASLNLKTVSRERLESAEVDYRAHLATASSSSASPSSPSSSSSLSATSRHEVTVRNGKLVYALDGTVVDTPRYHAMFTFTSDGRFYVGRKVEGKFHHSSLAYGGRPVFAAGEIYAVNGAVGEINLWSGHYRTSPEALEAAVRRLREMGLAIPDSKVSYELPDDDDEYDNEDLDCLEKAKASPISVNNPAMRAASERQKITGSKKLHVIDPYNQKSKSSKKSRQKQSPQQSHLKTKNVKSQWLSGKQKQEEDFGQFQFGPMSLEMELEAEDPFAPINDDDDDDTATLFKISFDDDQSNSNSDRESDDDFKQPQRQQVVPTGRQSSRPGAVFHSQRRELSL